MLKISSLSVRSAVPSTQYIVALANIFSVSADYLLGMESTSSGLSDKGIELLNNIIEYLKNKT